ncbi:MAG: hypothetical protein MN733_28675 [Nitrososphaera sp.]|nr:hypothetical protein [Nitrososphaera sp.]
MFRQERNSNPARNVLVIAQIATVTIIVIALLNYLWQNTQIRSLDASLQVMIGGIFILLIVLVANYILERRW